MINEKIKAQSCIFKTCLSTGFWMSLAVDSSDKKERWDGDFSSPSLPYLASLALAVFPP